MSGVGRLFRSDERGVTDTMGYVLLVGIVITAAFFTFAGAMPVIEEKQHTQYMHNVESGFEVYADNLDDIVHEQGPARATEMNLDGGSLFGGNDTTINVTVTTPDSSTSYISDSTAIPYTKHGTTVVYESGSVIWAQDGGQIMHKEPPMRFGEDHTTISLITTTIAGEQQVVGPSGKITLISRHSGTQTRAIHMDDDSDKDITVRMEVTSPQYQAWGDYFESQGLTEVTTNETAQTVVYEHQTDDLYIRETLIRVSTGG